MKSLLHKNKLHWIFFRHYVIGLLCDARRTFQCNVENDAKTSSVPIVCLGTFANTQKVASDMNEILQNTFCRVLLFLLHDIQVQVLQQIPDPQGESSWLC